MAVLKTVTRNALSDNVFGLPKKRKYPMPDKAHAANAKSRAAQATNLEPGEKAQIDAKANRVLGKSEGPEGSGDRGMLGGVKARGRAMRGGG